MIRASLDYFRTYAVALSRISMRNFLPAAAWYFAFFLCAAFPGVARESRTQIKMKHRSAEGLASQLRKPYKGPPAAERNTKRNSGAAKPPPGPTYGAGPPSALRREPLDEPARALAGVT